MFFVSGIQLLLPQFIRTMLDDYIPNKKLQEALLYFCLIVAAFLIRGVMVVKRNNQMLSFGYSFISRLRIRIMRHLQLLSSRYYDSIPMGDIIIRMLDDVMNVEHMTTNSLLTVVSSGIIIVGVAIMLFATNWSLALVGLLVMPIYLFSFVYFQKRLQQGHRSIQRNYEEFTSEFTESISGIKVIKSLNLEQFKTNKVEQYIGQDKDMRIKTHTLNAIFNVIGEFLNILGTAMVLFYGGWLVMREKITVGQVIAFYTYVGYLYSPLLQIVNTVQTIQRGQVSMERIYELLDTRPWPQEKPTAIDPRPIKGKIEFKDVTFYYERSKLPNLSHINFSVDPGKSVALVGASGAGKSTIINLILRFYDPAEGHVLLDEKDISDFKINEMRQCMAIVLQEGFLFSGTVYDNIRMGRMQANHNEVEEAARQAQAWDFIQSLPNGIHTQIGEQGINVSGGQKQLISIARAILRNAPIVLLDEATSALDSEIEHLVQKSMESLRRNRSTITIAHHLSTVRTADEILVMQKGQIVERGRHKELLAQEGYYKRLYELQFAK